MSVTDDLRVKQIFSEAVELSGAARAAFLDQACAGDALLRSRVEALIRASERVEQAAHEPPTGFSPDVAEGPGSTIGPYRLLQLIGEGGFGSVFLAEQSVPLNRRVALKVIKLGMDARAVIARFEAERQALAIMDHPNIARVYDAGATGSGRPYFVMELVKGEPITTYCDHQNLTIEDRLELFAQVCRAVQHAHAKGVIHRDIKPSNVLVSTQDGKTLAKVIDFGIAKATSSRLTEKTVFTHFNQLIGTPEYMSPEQAEGSLDIDTRTDIYALGVLLYELLTGATPFDPRRLRSAAYDEMRRIIREDEPPKPSTRLLQSTDTLPGVAARRRTEPARLGTLVRGDLDWIVMKCLDKDRARRYETAEGLAADLSRHLQGQAVLAAPPSPGYRLRKFVRRHRGPVIAAGAIALALAAGAGIAVAGYVSAVKARDAEKEQHRQADLAREAAQASAAEALQSAESAKREEAKAVQARDAEKEQRRQADLAREAAQNSAAEALQSADRAEREAAKMLAINIFFRDLLRGVNPENAHANRNVTVRELVDKSAAGLDAGRLKDLPEIEAAVRGTVGELYRALGDPGEARRHLVRAIELGESGAQTRDEMAGLRIKLGNAFRDLNDVESAETAYLKALDDDAADGEQDPVTAAGLYNNLGGVALHRGDLDKAEELLSKAKALLAGVDGADDRRALQVNWNLAVLAQKRGDLQKAEALIKEVTDRGVSQFTEDDPLAAGALRNLAVAIGNQHRFKEAVPVARRTVEAFRRIDGDTHPETIDALQTLGDIAYAGGYYTTAHRAHREILDFHRAAADHAYDLRFDLHCVANDLEPDGRAADAEPLRREALDIARAAGDQNALSGALANLGFNLVIQRRWADAEPPLRECLEIRENLFAPPHPRYWSVVNCQSMLGEALLGRAEEAAPSDSPRALELFRQAESLIIPAAEDLPTDPGVPDMMPGQPDLRGLPVARAVRLYRAWGESANDPALTAKAAAWQEKYDAYQSIRQAKEPDPLPPPPK